MATVKINKVKKEIETLSSVLSSADAQNIFYDIVFKKKVEEGLKEADEGMVTDWNDFKKEMRSWYKSK
jgi:predicted transcriptional regulator